MIKKLLLIGLLIVFVLNISAQKVSTQYKAAYDSSKQLLDQGKYALAIPLFKKLLAGHETNKLTPYTQFYLANAAYQIGKKEYAKNLFLQIKIQTPSWDKIEAVYLWLSRIGFEQSGVFKGMLYAKKIKSEPYLTKSNAFLKSHLKTLSIHVLSKLYEKYPNTKEIGKAFALAIDKQPSNSEYQIKLEPLITKFNFDKTKFKSVSTSIFKKKYNIGILLPFFINRVEAIGKHLKKSLAVDIYEGAKMAAYDIDSTLFNLQVYDTRKDTKQLNLILTKGGLNKLDAVLGPIYPRLVAKMGNFSANERLIFVNPTSSNAKNLNHNPYAFLLRASATQLAIKTANYMKTQAVNKNLFIYYGTSKIDSIAAYVYKREMESDSFTTISILKIGKNNKREIYDVLTASKKVLDSTEIKKMTEEQIEQAFQLPTIDSLLIQPDSLGHIFIASSDLTIANEAMSAIISRRDSINIKTIGVGGNWFESNTAAYGIMEKLGVTLAISSIDDITTQECKMLTKRYIETYNSKPSKFFFRGYFSMKLIGKSLKKYGTHFQNKYQQKENLDLLFDFKNSNANGSIKIMKIINHQIKELQTDTHN